MKYECKYCLFYTDLKPIYIRHISTQKHKRNSGQIDEKRIKSSLHDSTKVAQKSTNFEKSKKSTNEHKSSTNEHNFNRMRILWQGI